MTTLAHLFAKPIDRPIEGVIKADDQTSLLTEVEEYVLTQEVATRLGQFLDAYNNPKHINGAWISGFFGSGKSHLLKMLALLLENKAIGDTNQRMLDLFLPKCDDGILEAELKRAVQTPSQSILFNIDQKANVIDKSQTDALLAVFAKVFDELCGYLGRLPYVAQFERDLDGRGLYQSFQQAFAARAGMSWLVGRDQALLEADNIAHAYAQITNTPPSTAHGILDRYRADYKLSIEDLAEQINQYIQRQPPHFRLNFFVDEVGQYIAESTRLMTNLQTLAESLHTRCHGRAWIIVTAQEDMDTMLGEMSKQQGHDFSKIQARFAVRLKLTSTNVEDVIRERLLRKNETGTAALLPLYQREHTRFRTLFDFPDGTQNYRNYRTEEQFIHTYPFVLYQFTLFQSAIQTLSEHNAFEGRHSSVGERSMLGVFQDVAKHLQDQPVGQLATFDRMFDGLRASFKSQIQRSVLNAELNLEKDRDGFFAVRVLKALFLVKYIREFKASARNIATLLYDGFDTDLPEHHKAVQTALNTLERQTYIQRDGQFYEYLTDEEKDIEQEIKNTDLEAGEQIRRITTLLFDEVLRDRKYRYAEYGRDYDFARKVDNQLDGREQELTIHIITPLHPNSHDPNWLKSHSMGRDELFVLLPAESGLPSEVAISLMTDKYIRQHTAAAQKESVRRILEQKQGQNRERGHRLRDMAAEALGHARLFVNGRELLHPPASEPKPRLFRGLEELLANTYYKLPMLRGHHYKEEELVALLQNDTPTLLATLTEAEQEMLNYIHKRGQDNLRTTMQQLVSQFERKPYGWGLTTIQALLAKLINHGKMELSQDSNELADIADIRHALTNTHAYSQLLLYPQIEFTASQIRALKEFYNDFFQKPAPAQDGKQLGKATADEFAKYTAELNRRASDMHRDGYPFATALQPLLALLEQVKGWANTDYLTKLDPYTDDLLEAKEQTADPLIRWLEGASRTLYNTIRDYVRQQQANLPYLPPAGTAELSELQTLLADRNLYKGQQMKRLNELYTSLQGHAQAQLAHVRTSANDQLRQRWQGLANTAEFQRLTPAQQSQLEQPFARAQDALTRETLIPTLNDSVRLFEAQQIPRLLNLLHQWANPAPPPPPANTGQDDTEVTQVVKEIQPTITYIPRHAIQVPFGKPWLADEEDIEAYLQALRQALHEALRHGQHIQL